eukprot:CAMPEP_0170484926 /NCGR_PEP_ID=MMETSP0208-20121228/4297_1 /TAXON_ID=197538 /ORGANISM="Strombidium inclinatum, Strain S3" /LENGTH=79 /DNA_ID=CAMNT_0010758405 /DNA_START=2191 /DNA_END=2430 /DNA_ORIENTATION=-
MVGKKANASKMRNTLIARMQSTNEKPTPSETLSATVRDGFKKDVGIGKAPGVDLASKYLAHIPRRAPPPPKKKVVPPPS